MIEQKADASAVPTKTSDLENDSGFISNVYWEDISDKPDLQNYATMAYVDEKLDVEQQTVDSKIEFRAPLIRRWSI